jgi:tetratricopeptide (TPR) repeat protein
VFAKALAKDPRARFTSGAEFVAALRASLEHAAGPTRIVAPPPTVRRVATRRRSPLVPVLVLLGLALLGGVLAYALTRDGSSPKAAPPHTVRVTVQGAGQTVVTTVVSTAQASTTTPPSTTAAGGDPVAENNQAYDLIKQGDFNDALPLLEDAQRQLSGQGGLAEAYTDYNLGYVLMQVGRCSDALPYLERSLQIQPRRHEVRDAIKQAQKCGGGSGG